MTQFGSFLPEDQFETTQDMPFGEYPLAPDESAFTNAGSYGFDPMSQPAAPQDDMARLEATKFPQASLEMQGLMPPDEFAQLRQQLQPQDQDFDPTAEFGLRPGAFEQYGDASIDSPAALLWDEATGGDERRLEEHLREQAAARGAPTLEEMEEAAPRQSMTQMIQGMEDMESTQGVTRGSLLGIPLGYKNDPNAARVMERRNVARAMRTGEDLPELTEYFNEQKFPVEEPGFWEQAAKKFSRGLMGVLTLPERLLVEMPAGTIAYFTDGQYGSDVLRAAAENAKYISLIADDQANNGFVKQLVLDAVETAPQLIAQLGAAALTGGQSAVAQLGVFAATGAGQAATSQWAESMRTNMDAGLSATAAAANANRDAATAFASTFVTEAVVGKVLKPFGVGVKFDEMTTRAIRRAAGLTTAQAIVRGGTRGMIAEGVQEFADQALTDFAVNMYRLDQAEFKKFYEQNPDWVMDVFRNAAYAGLVGALVGVPAGVMTGISTRNGAAATAAQLDRIAGRLPENSPVRRLMERGDLNIDDVDTVMRWFVKNQAKLAIENATDNKQMRTLGAALNMDGIETETLQDIILRGNNDGAVTASLRGATRGVGKFGSMQFVVTPAMAADEMVRRNLMSGRTQEQVQPTQAAMPNTEGGMIVIFKGETERDAVDRFVQENPVVASRLANAEFISRRMAESFIDPSVREATVDSLLFDSRQERDYLHDLIKRAVERQQAEMDPRRLQERIDNQRRGAESQVIAELNGLTPEEVARVASGVSPRKARIVSQVMQEAEQQAAMPISADATVEERIRRMEDREFVQAVRAREPGRAATKAEREQATPEAVSARRQRNAEAALREKFDRELDAAVDVAWKKRQVELYTEAIEQRGADGRMEEQVALDLLTAIELPENAGTAEITREFVEQEMRDAGATDEDIADVTEAARRRAKTLEEEFRRVSREEAIGILDEAEQQAKQEDPNYIVSMPDAVQILINEASDETKQDIADVVASGRSLGLMFLEATDLPEASSGEADAAELRLRGALDNIRRTREINPREPSRIPGIAEVRAERDAALVEEQQKVDAELTDLRKQKAMLEKERQPLLEEAWMTKPKGKKPAQKRKKRAPMTDAEQAIVNRIREVDEKIAALEQDQASILEQRGIVSQAMPEPEAVDATATFPNQDTGRKRRLIEEARQQIADINDIDINDVKMRYADGKTTLTKQEKRFVNFGKKLGITVVFVQTPGNSTMAGAYKNGVVFLSAQDINRPSAMFAIAMHETIHYLHESNPELFRGLYNALNKRVPRALRELRKSYTARLDQVSRVNAVRRAGLIMLNDENESSRDAILWVARNDDSEEAALLRANMPDQLAAALDDQDLSAIATPTNDVANEYRKEFKKRFSSGLRAPLSESQLRQEEIANLAELVMDGAFVTIVGDDGKINIDEVRRLADTKPTISRFAALASAIMDAFAIIPGMTKKARGLNDAQVALLRKFADKPGELASPRARNVAQQLIAQSLVKMMDAKRGNVPAGDIGASPMSNELAGARIPALDFSIRIAMPDDRRSELFAGEERGLPAVDPTTPSRISQESLDFAIRAIASDDNPIELKLVGNQLESDERGRSTQLGITPAGFANTEDGRRWYIKHLVGEHDAIQRAALLQRAASGTPRERISAIREIQYEGVRKYHLQNELAANLMAESLGMPGVMPIRGFFVNNGGRVVDVQASEVVPNFQTLDTGGSVIPWETTLRMAGVSSILAVGDAHGGNITEHGNMFDFGMSLGLPPVAQDAFSVSFITLEEHGTTAENTPMLSAVVNYDELASRLFEDRNTAVDGLNSSFTADVGNINSFGNVINKKDNLLPIARRYARDAITLFARNYAEATQLADPTSKLKKFRHYLAGSLFEGLIYGYSGSAVRRAAEIMQITESPEVRQNVSRVLRELSQDFKRFADSGDAIAALEAVSLGRGYPFLEPEAAEILRESIADAVRTRALMVSNFYNTIATLNDGESAFDEDEVARARLESIGERINFSIRRPESVQQPGNGGGGVVGVNLPRIDTTTETLGYNNPERYKYYRDGVGIGFMKPSEYLRLVLKNSFWQRRNAELATYLSNQLDSLGIKVRLVDETSIPAFRQYYSQDKHEYTATLNVELMSVNKFIHEALHAVTANAIEDTMGMTVYSPRGAEYVARVAAFARTMPTTRRGVAIRDLCQLWLYVSGAGTNGSGFNYGPWAAADLILPTTFRGYDELAARDSYAAQEVQYGMSNLDEFVAQSFSSQDMVDYLRSIKLPKTAVFESFSNAWELFKDIVSRIFGFAALPGEETAHDRLLAIVADIMEGNVTARARQGAGSDLGGIPLGDQTMLKVRTSTGQVEAVPLREVSQARLPLFPTSGPYTPAQTDLLTGSELYARMRSTFNVDPSLERFAEWNVYPQDPVLNARNQPTSLPEFSIRRIPQEVIDTAGVENSIAAAQSQKFKSIRDFKLVIQKQVRDAATRNNTTVHDRDSAVIDEYITAVAISDAKYALGMKNNAVGWYDEKVKKALAIMSLVYPELNADERAQFVMKMALAITSNSMEVSENFRLAARAYDAYKRTGKLPTNIGSGQTGKVMDESFARFNNLVKKKGFDWVMNFSNTMYTVREIYNLTGKRVNGESVNQVVYGAAIFGPKIGNGFFANLNGKYEQLTMDRWFMRTWGRWIGLLVNNNRALAESQREELRNSLLGLTEGRKGSRKATKQGKRTLDFIGSEIGEDLVKFVNTSMSNARLTEIAGKIARRSSKQEFRDAVERLPSGDLIRRQSNAHTKTLDGSIETPGNPSTRKRIRRVMGMVLAELQKTYPALTMADLQALYWYPEKRLYDTAKVQDDGSMQYETGGLPDYEQAAIAFAKSRKIPESDINAAIKQVDAQRRSVVSVRRAARGGRNAARRGGRVQEEPRKPLDFALRNEPSTYEPASATDADSVINMALRSGGVRTEVEDRLGALGRAWMGTARQLAARAVPSAISVEDSDDISIVTDPADISPFWKFIAAPLNLAIGSKNPEVISVVEDMINMDIERNLTTKSRQEEANAVWESIPPDERDSEEFSRYMDAYHPPETIDTNAEFQSKSQAWRNALKWFKEREEVRRREIIDTKRDSIRGMLKRDNSSRLVNRAAQYGLTWEVVRNERGRKMIQTPEGMITINQAREALVETMIPDNWGRQYAHFYHWFNGDFKLIGYSADGTRTILGSAITEPEAYEKLYAFKRANPGVYQRLVAEPAVRIDPDDSVRMSDAQRRRLEKMLADATGAYRDEVADAMRGIVGSKTSKRPFYAPLMERTGAGGFVTDFIAVWNMSERLHNRWRMGGDMVRQLTPRIESIRRNTPGWGDYLAESMRHTLFTAPTMTEAAIDSMIRAIPIFGKIVSPFPTRRWLGSIRALNYARQLLTVRQQVVNSFQPLQTVYPILGEKGMMEAVAFYNSDEGKLVLRKYGFFDGSARFREGDEGAIGANIMDFVSSMNDKIYRATNENFNPSSEARNQNFAFVAMYHHGKYRLGMDDAEAVRYGRVYGNVYTQFYYTKANIPWLLRGPIASTTLQYRRFAINTTGLLVNEFQKGNYSGVARYMATMSMLGGLQASIGLSAASLIRSLYLGDKEGADDLNYKLRAWLKSELGSERMADIAMMGLPAALGIDLSGSISIWQKPFGRNIYEKIGATVAGPTVNTAIQLMTNLTAETAVPMGAGERFARGLLDSSPAAQQITSLWKLFSGSNEEYDSRGRLKYKLDPEEQFLKALAFRTVNETVWSMEYQRLRIIRNEVDRYANEAATYLAVGNRDMAQKVLRTFNSMYPMASMNMKDIERRAKNKMQSRQMPQLERRIDVESGVVARRIADAEGLGDE